MSATTIIEQAFGPNANLYTTVLQLVPAAQQEKEKDFSKDFTPSQLRKAYYRQALQYHPDKQSNKSPQEKEQAKLKFQAISIAYSILSDKDRKQLYDETGELDDGDDDENGGNGFVNKQNSNAWKEYFKGIFGKVTTSDIDKFAESYKCSQEEENDVLKYYKQFRGDLNKMLECVMCSEEVDKKRWVEDYIGPAVERGQVPDYTKKVKDTMGHVSDHDYNDDDDNEEEDEEETVTEDESDDNDTNKKKRKSTVVQPKSKAPTTKTKKSKKISTEPPVSQDLIAAIRGKGGGGGSSGGQRGLDSLLAGLEERYASNKNVGKNNNKKKNKERVQDIPDEEFEKIQKRLESQRRRKK